MATGHDTAAIGALLRKRGLPERPVVGIPVTEIRSDGFLGQVPTLDSGVHVPALAGLVLEWNYALPYHMLPEVLQFLSDNDQFIADAVRKAMTGVTYFGTYMSATGERASFKTIWGYATWDAHNEWAKVVATAGTPNSRLYDLVTQLRTYWLMDPNGDQKHLAYAATVKIADHPFLAMTVDADKKANGK